MYPSPSFRASDADREAVVAHLSTALGEGRLSLAEFDARARHVYAARTWGELTHIVRDLPPLPVAAAETPRQDPVWPALALVFGVLSVLLAFCLPVSVVLGLGGIVFGSLGLHKATRGAGRRAGMALAGLICGSAGLLLTIAFTIYVAALD
ncbi:DUF1707 and DUF4190 domain-containing protein [Dactylosporangium sp. NPDC005555]|uniref:DUF1707 and DUF4190 domain-containing protein n=1 Tax=Dactylosporangium sp. NPDC005555 TaxID=3154889 RepID=UPI0033BD606C